MNNPIYSANTLSHDERWMQVRETKRMLFLATAQIEIAQRESDDSVGHLTTTSTAMAEHETEVSSTARLLTEKQGQNEFFEQIGNSTDAISAWTHDSIVAFRFYDRLGQSLAHGSLAMEKLTQLLDDRNRIDSSEACLAVQSEIKSKYSMRDEHELFEAAIKEGEDVRQAVRRYNDVIKKQKTAAPAVDGVEFF